MYFNHKLFGNTPREPFGLFLGNSLFLFLPLGLKRKQSHYTTQNKQVNPPVDGLWLNSIGTGGSLTNEALRWISAAGKNCFDCLFGGEVPGAVQAWRAGVGEKSKMLILTVSQSGNWCWETWVQDLTQLKSTFFVYVELVSLLSDYQKSFQINTSPSKYLRNNLRS